MVYECYHKLALVRNNVRQGSRSDPGLADKSVKKYIWGVKIIKCEKIYLGGENNPESIVICHFGG